MVLEDNGPGLPPEIVGHLFEPFTTTKRGSGGTGLGLSVVKSIMDLHQGTIQISNRPEGGLRVVLTFGR